MKKFYSLFLLMVMSLLGFAAQAAEVTINVDDPSHISVLSIVGKINISAETQVVDIQPGTLAFVMPAEGYEIKTVTLNGVEQPILGGNYNINTDETEYADGDVLDITTAAVSTDPEEPQEPEDPQVTTFKVSFDFADEAARAFITGVSIYNEPVTDWIDGFEVEQGTPLEISYDTNLRAESVKINGEDAFMMMGVINVPPIESDIVIYVKLLEVKEMAVTVNVDNAAAVAVGYNKTTTDWFFPTTTFVTFPLVDGANELTIDPTVTETLTIKAAAAGASITSITVNGEAVEVTDEVTVAITDGMVIDITTATAERDAVATVNCDDPSAITLTVGGNVVELTETTTEISFFSESENTFTITAANYDVTIYAVTHNGNPVEKSAWTGNYTIYGVQNGDVIEVVTTPQEFTLAFNFADEASKAVISRVTVRDGMAEIDITDQLDTVLSFTQGTYVSVYTNPDMEVEEFTVEGSEVMVYPNEYDFSLAGNTVVTIKAAEKAKTVFTIDVDDAANVRVYYNTVTFNILGIPQVVQKDLDLVDGANVFEMADAPEAITIEAREGAKIDFVTVDGDELVSYTDIPVVNGMTIVVESSTAHTTAIASVLCGSRTADVYSVTGVKVLKAADANAISALPAGVYVVNGRKLIIR